MSPDTIFIRVSGGRILLKNTRFIQADLRNLTKKISIRISKHKLWVPQALLELEPPSGQVFPTLCGEGGGEWSCIRTESHTRCH